MCTSNVAHALAIHVHRLHRECSLLISSDGLVSTSPGIQCVEASKHRNCAHSLEGHSAGNDASIPLFFSCKSNSSFAASFKVFPTFVICCFGTSRTMAGNPFSDSHSANSPASQSPPSPLSSHSSSLTRSSAEHHFRDLCVDPSLIPSPRASANDLADNQEGGRAYPSQAAMQDSSADSQARKRPFSFVITSSPRWTKLKIAILVALVLAIVGTVVAIAVSVQKHPDRHHDLPTSGTGPIITVTESDPDDHSSATSRNSGVSTVITTSGEESVRPTSNITSDPVSTTETGESPTISDVAHDPLSDMDSTSATPISAVDATTTPPARSLPLESPALSTATTSSRLGSVSITASAPNSPTEDMNTMATAKPPVPVASLFPAEEDTPQTLPTAPAAPNANIPDPDATRSSPHENWNKHPVGFPVFRSQQHKEGHKARGGFGLSYAATSIRIIGDTSPLQNTTPSKIAGVQTEGLPVLSSAQPSTTLSTSYV